jgi:hypothetical protein
MDGPELRRLVMEKWRYPLDTRSLPALPSLLVEISLCPSVQFASFDQSVGGPSFAGLTGDEMRSESRQCGWRYHLWPTAFKCVLANTSSERERNSDCSSRPPRREHGQRCQLRVRERR